MAGPAGTEMGVRAGGRAGGYSRLEQEGAEGAAEDKIKIKIKTLDDSKSWEVTGEGSWTVRQLKDHLKSAYQLENQRIRLILLGRMLEDSHTLASCGLKDGDFVHAAICEEPPPVLDVAISVNARRADGEDDGGPRGFDRLLRAGFTQSEVDFLRAQFHARRGHGAARLTEIEAVELEEDWLEQTQQDRDQEGMGGVGGERRFEREMDMVGEGTQADMILGLVMGFVFGVIMLFWIWERGIPRRQKLGILCGIGANLMMGMVRLQARTRAKIGAGHNLPGDTGAGTHHIPLISGGNKGTGFASNVEGGRDNSSEGVSKGFK
ncbi:DUF2407 C-terminal domain-containing protein, partial [Baffinella frigidus]